MLDFLQKDTFFWVCALIGTGLFTIQFLFNVMGVGEDADIDHDQGVDAGNFKWLSKQAVTGFLMLFGWTALTCRKEFDLGDVATICCAIVAGVIAVLVTGAIFKMARKLHSSGNVFKIEDTIGKEAIVYHRISKGSAGKITVSHHQLTHEIDAISQSGEEIPSFARVQIIKKADDKTVVVIPL